MQDEKVSHGIVLVRPASRVSDYEILLVRRRTSYAYSDIVLGRYARNLQGRELKAYLSLMTIDELLILRTLNFTLIWNRMFSAPPDSKKLIKFTSSFVERDEGRALVAAIDNTKPTTLELWEPPKGRRRPRESEPMAAVREFMEETKISCDNYRIIPGQHTMCWESQRRRYRVVYYAALVLNNMSEINLSVSDFRSIGEVDRCQWFRLSDIDSRRIVNADRLRQMLAPLVRMVKKRYRPLAAADVNMDSVWRSLRMLE